MGVGVFVEKHELCPVCMMCVLTRINHHIASAPYANIHKRATITAERHFHHHLPGPGVYLLCGRRQDVRLQFDILVPMPRP